MKGNIIEKLVKTFKEETENQKDGMGEVFNYHIDTYYRKNNPEKGYHSLDANYYFGSYTLRLEYKINVSMIIPKSTLEMRFMFEEGKYPVEYSIYDILSIVDKDNFNTYTIASITTEEEMIEGIKYLVDTFIKYKEKIDELVNNTEKMSKLENNVDDNIFLLLNDRVFKSRDVDYLTNILELYYVVDTSRYTCLAYNEYVNGKYKKSLREYKKIGKLTEYEKRLVEYMKQNLKDTEIKKSIPDNLNTMNKARKLKNIKTELIPFYITWPVLIPLWLIIYGLLFVLVQYLVTQNSLYSIGASTINLIMPAFITSGINAYFVKDKVLKIFCKKDYAKIRDLNEIQDVTKNMFMSKVFQFAIAASIVFTILVANTNIVFYENYFINKLELLNLKGTLIEYTDINTVHEVDKFELEYGIEVNEKTYIIELKDETKINLYLFEDYDVLKENLLPILKKQNVEIKDINSLESIESSGN